MNRLTRTARLVGPAAVALFAIIGALMSRQQPIIAWGCAAVAIMSAAAIAAAGLTHWRLAGALIVPVAALTVQGFGQASTLSWMAFCVMAMWIGLSAAPRPAVALTALMVAIVAWMFLRQVREPGWAAWSIGTIISVVACIMARALNLTNEALRNAQGELAQRSREEERVRLAAEVHDVIGHGLTVTLLHISSARLALDEGRDAADRELAEAERLTRSSLDEVRATVGLWRDKQDASPLPDAGRITELVKTFRLAGMRVELFMTGGVDDVGGARGLAAYRVIQESLTNAARHAPNAAVTVRVDVADGNVDVCVDSDGTPGPNSPGSGIRGMSERVQALGGTFSAGPHEGGWRVAAVLPR
ncbi:sensor histidine kinase [Cumulibacter soli]|uniref:sensor histidine kinase n=1 Tax=Cumulibacter soli TaxID=2546344 RepID=UPI001068880A|nr:histidine kinase [Cumulibacter soli]